MNLLDKTKTWFNARNQKPSITIERQPSKITSTLTNTTSQKIVIVLDDWVRYIRISSTNRVYACVGSTIQDYTAIAVAPIKEKGLTMMVYANIPSKIIRVAGSRTLTFVVASLLTTWTSVEMWGEDDL